ncbi:unnamed protein product [Schistocephalus solidus]|uniref:RAE1/2 domain-containing protein n=1 Tax=Schistocephalus solidus TaxID=70667 RepID=A0A183SSA3_SCHSO|nr:unnamed protein product [Schistocephalus solidus]
MDEAPTFTDVLSPSEITSGGEQSTSQNDQPALDPRPSSRLASPTTGTAKETSPAPVASAGRIQPSDTAPSENSYRENPSHSLITHPPRQWSQATLKRQLHRLDLDIMPKTSLTFPENLKCRRQTILCKLYLIRFFVSSSQLIYADSPMVTAMLRTDVTRYLEFRPVSRLLTFARQASRLQDSTPQASSSSSDTNTLPAFRSLIKVILIIRPFILFSSSTKTDSSNISSDDVYHCLTRMSAVFSCVYCLHRTVENVIRLPDPGFSSTPAADSSTTRPRRLCIKLSSGEEIKTSGFLVSALNSPTAWVLPQVHRWLARAILISSSSIYPQEFKPHDISLLPLTLPYPPNENSDELAFLLEIPVEERNTNLFVAHMWIACQELKDPRNLFGPIIDILYRKGKDVAPQKPQLLWACFFALPDLSNVAKNFKHWFSESNPIADHRAVDPMIVVPGLDTTLSMDAALHTAETVFSRAFSLIHRGFPTRARTAHVPGGESDQQTTTSHPESSSFLSLEAHWDGVFPPSPPSLEDLILMETEEPDESSGIQLTHPSLAPSGHGDWSTSALEFSLESEQDSTPPES